MKLIGGGGDGGVLLCGCLDLYFIVLRCLLTPLRNLLRSLMLLQNKRATLLVTLLSFDFPADIHISTTLPVRLCLRFTLLFGLGMGDFALHSFN